MEEKPDRAGKILLVNEQDDFALTVVDTLLSEGYDAEIVCDGVTAFSKVLVNEYDLILLDINLNGTSGPDLLEKLKKEPRTKSTPLLFLTTSEDEENIYVRSFESRAVDCLRKPLHKPELLFKVKN
jgi:DNA-binding response OmpR family regulator